MAHSKHIKGEDVNLLIGGKVIAASESCDFSLTANTSDTSAKDDPGLGEWDNPTFENYSWNASNSSYVVDIDDICDLLAYVASDAKVSVVFNMYNGFTAYTLSGTAIITSLEIDAPADGKAKINISLDGCTPLTPSTGSKPTAASTIKNRIKGKALMLAIGSKSGDSTVYNTVMCATSHKFSISVQTSDVSDKDSNDSFQYKEVTGRSFSLSTDNLIPTYNGSDTGISPTSIMSILSGGSEVDIKFSYYESSIGAEANNHDWGDISTVTGSKDELLVQGKYICTSFQINGQVKQNATYSATFSGKGAPTIRA